MQKLNKEKVLLERTVEEYDQLVQRIGDSEVLCEMAVEENDESTFNELVTEVESLEKLVEELNLKVMLSGELDGQSVYLSIQFT